MRDYQWVWRIELNDSWNSKFSILYISSWICLTAPPPWHDNNRNWIVDFNRRHACCWEVSVLSSSIYKNTQKNILLFWLVWFYCAYTGIFIYNSSDLIFIRADGGDF